MTKINKKARPPGKVDLTKIKNDRTSVETIKERERQHREWEETADAYLIKRYVPRLHGEGVRLNNNNNSNNHNNNMTWAI